MRWCPWTEDLPHTSKPRLSWRTKWHWAILEDSLWGEICQLFSIRLYQSRKKKRKRHCGFLLWGLGRDSRLLTWACSPLAKLLLLILRDLWETRQGSGEPFMMADIFANFLSRWKWYFCLDTNRAWEERDFSWIQLTKLKVGTPKLGGQISGCLCKYNISLWPNGIIGVTVFHFQHAYDIQQLIRQSKTIRQSFGFLGFNWINSNSNQLLLWPVKI